MFNPFNHVPINYFFTVIRVVVINYHWPSCCICCFDRVSRPNWSTVLCHKLTSTVLSGSDSHVGLRGGFTQTIAGVSVNASRRYLLLLQLIDAVPEREHLKSDTAAALTCLPRRRRTSSLLSWTGSVDWTLQTEASWETIHGGSRISSVFYFSLTSVGCFWPDFCYLSNQVFCYQLIVRYRINNRRRNTCWSY